MMRFTLLLTLAVLATCSGNPLAGNNTLKNTIQSEVFRADFSKSTLSAAFGGVGISYGNQNVILWASGGGIEVWYPGLHLYNLHTLKH